MKDKRFWFGIALSAIWIAVMAAFIVRGKWPEEINGWGDFFAGFFAPIAFLWLVLGYMQQGEELRAQAKELENSVRQQSALVEVSREQLAHEMRTLREERDASHRAAQPRLVLKPLQSSGTDPSGFFSGSFAFINHGAPASGLQVEVSAPHRMHDELHSTFMERSQRETLILVMQTDHEMTLRVHYLDGLGRPGEVMATFHPKDFRSTSEIALKPAGTSNATP